MVATNSCMDVLDPPCSLAETTSALHENDLSMLSIAGPRAMAESVSACAVRGRDTEVAESRAPAVVGREALSILAAVEAEEAASGPLATMLRHAGYIRPELFQARAKLGRAVASSGWVPRLVVGSVAARHPRIALARAEANAVRLSAIAAKPLPARTGEQRPDALARLTAEIGRCRLQAWSLLAELRAAACISAKESEVHSARCQLSHELQRLNVLAHRRRQALLDGGKTEAAYRSRMDRMERALEIRDQYLDRARFENDCLFNAADKAESELLCIKEALNHYRADAWGHIADFQKRRALGFQPEPGAVADLRHCRVRIAELNADLSAAEAASDAAAEAENLRGPLSDVCHAEAVNVL